jgi:CHASE2 domain-containing sensor protein
MTNGTSLDKPLEPKWLFYILSFIIWPVGIILGILYMRKPDPDCKAFGKMCLILGIVAVVLLCLCWLILAVGCGGMSAIT